MAVLLALAAAASYGTSDFIAGLMGRRASVFLVTLVAQATGSVVLLLVAPFSGAGATGSHPRRWPAS